MLSFSHKGMTEQSRKRNAEQEQRNGYDNAATLAHATWKSSQAEDRSASNPYDEAVSEADCLMKVGTMKPKVFTEFWCFAFTHTSAIWMLGA